MKVVVAGWVASFPMAGFLWHPVSFALGFRDLGHEVWFLDDLGDEPWGWDPGRGVQDNECRAGVAFLEREMRSLGLDGRWMVRDESAGVWHGMPEDAARTVLAEADLFVNVSLTCPMRSEYRQIPLRAAIDTDPVFTQVRIALDDEVLRVIPDTHTRLFTFGRPPLPAQRHEWVPTRQPMATAEWPVAAPIEDGPFTTLTTWKAYKPEVWDGIEYGAKDRSMRDFLDLPSHTTAELVISLGGGEDQQVGARTLSEHGWSWRDPLAASLTTDGYRRFMTDSAGELGFAKHGYVAGRSGWFSERTCCYLASGRPAIVQDTGWTEWLPSGEGVIGFSTIEEAVAGIEAVRSDPHRHSAAARRLVEEHFEAAAVCAEILAAM